MIGRATPARSRQIASLREMESPVNGFDSSFKNRCPRAYCRLCSRSTAMTGSEKCMTRALPLPAVLWAFSRQSRFSQSTPSAVRPAASAGRHPVSFSTTSKGRKSPRAAPYIMSHSASVHTASAPRLSFGGAGAAEGTRRPS